MGQIASARNIKVPLNLELRQSDSPFIEKIWRSRSENIDTFMSIAASRWEIVVWRQWGKLNITLRGPETKASRSPVPENTEFFGILFKSGAFMPHFPVSQFINNGVVLPEAGSKSFWLNGSAWQFPNYDNAETFVDWLAHDGLLVREPIVNDVLRGYLPRTMSLRSVQRRFLYASGLTYRTMQQIERARQAAFLLQQGTPILDVTHELGYFDQAYLTKSVKHFIGQTPTQLMNRSEQLSLLYKTSPLLLDYDEYVDGKQQKERT
jgi:hypothetical protein